MSMTRTAVITGASAGIGAVYAGLARRGYDLVLVARDRTKLEALAKRLGAETGRNVEVLPADLTHKGDLLRVDDRLRTDTSISLLVNNAGVAAFGPLLVNDADRLDAMVQLNVAAPLRLARAAIEGFVARQSGR